jgi:hypothetical protein
MKNLIYSPFVLLIVLLAASCQKDDPITKHMVQSQQSDLSATINMVNNSDTPYEVSFQGANYTIDIQAHSRQSATIKAGTYDVEIYPAGSSDYVSHTITWGDLAPVLSPRANFTNVQINAGYSQGLLVY